MLPLLPAAQSITDVSAELPAWDAIISVLLLQGGFNSKLVLIGTGLLGVAAGIVGSFALLRKRALMGDALAHSALPGLCAAYMLSHMLGFEDKNFLFLLFGAALSGVAGVVVVQFLSHFTRLSEDSAIGVVLSVFFGAGVVLLSMIQSMQGSGAAGLAHFIYGQTAAMRSIDAVLISSTALFAVLCAYFLRKEFSLICFDREFAVVQGWPVSRIDLLMMALVTLVTVIGLQSVGIILVVSLLIIPAASARFWTESLNLMITLSALIGGFSGYIGAAASALFPRLPAGAVIVLVSGQVFLISFFFAPRRGILAGGVRLLSIRYMVFKDHLLRDIYETYETTRQASGSWLTYRAVPYLRTLTHWRRLAALKLFKLQGLLRIQGDSLMLSAAGQAEAERLIRNHRLWEQYIFEYADISLSHVDYSADFAEHVLSPEIVDKLEKKLSAAAEEAAATVPASMHPLEKDKADV